MRPARTLLLSLTLAGCSGSATEKHAPAAKPTPPSPDDASIDGDTPAAAVVALADVVIKEAPNGQATIREVARGKNAFMGILEIGPNAEIPEHQDPTEEYIHVVRGTGTIYIDGKQDFVRPGTTVYMPAGAKVSFRNGSAPMLVLQVFAGPQPADKYASWPKWDGTKGAPLGADETAGANADASDSPSPDAVADDKPHGH